MIVLSVLKQGVVQTEGWKCVSFWDGVIGVSRCIYFFAVVYEFITPNARYVSVSVVAEGIVLRLLVFKYRHSCHGL